MKRVAMIAYHTCPLASEEGKETGGMNVYVLELAKALGQQGVYVDIFTRAQDPSNPFEVQVTEHLTLYHLPAGPMAGLPKKDWPKYVPEFVTQLRLFLEKAQPTYTAWHAHYYLSGLVVQQLQAELAGSAFCQVPLVMQFHTLALMKNLVARNEAEQETQFRLKSEYELATQADLIISPSEYDRQYMRALYQVLAERIQVIPPGFNAELFKPMSAAEAKQHIGAELASKLIMFVGRIDPLKGVDNIMYALKILQARQPKAPVCLWIVGGDHVQSMDQWSVEQKRLDQVCRDLRMTASVKFVGQQPQHELPYYYNAAEVVVMASHYESFGMAALEAMACGVPVILSNVTGIASLLDERHGELITTVNNPLLLATQIEKVLNHSEARKKITSQLTHQVADLVWPVIAQKVWQTYEQITVKDTK